MMSCAVFGKAIFVLLAVLPSLFAYAAHTDAFMSYYSASYANYPMFREYTGVNFTYRQNASNVGANNGYWHRLATHPFRQQAILAVGDAARDVNAQVWDGIKWLQNTEFSTNTENTAYRSFDVAYESVSGDGMIVFVDDSDWWRPRYSVWDWDAGSWGGESEVSALKTNGTVRWVKLSENPKSDEIALITLDNNNTLTGHIWNGSEWGNRHVLEPNTLLSTRQCFDAEYEQERGRLIVAYNDGTNVPKYSIWNGSEWFAQASAINIGGQAQWVRLVPDWGNNTLMLGTLDNRRDINMQLWNGSQWMNQAELDNDVQTNAYRCFDMAYERGTNKCVLVFTDRLVNLTRTQVWDGSSWGPTYPTAIGPQLPYWVELVADPYSGEILLGMMDSMSDVNAQVWNGTNFTKNMEMASDSRNVRHAFSIKYFKMMRGYVSLSDTTDSETKYETDWVWFYANYSKRTNVSHNLTGHCRISFNVSGGWTAPRTMSYNSTLRLYQNRTNFSSSGLFYWNVSCNRTQYIRANRTSAFQISSKYKPDFQALEDGIAFSDEEPVPDEKIHINVTVDNLGSVRGVAVNVTVWIGASYLNSTLVNISGQGQATAMFPWNVSLRGEYVVNVSVDPLDRIGESLESNNNATAIVRVRYPQKYSAAMVTYYESAAATVPRYRFWNDDAWSDELAASNVGANNGYWHRLVPNPNSNEKILATLDGGRDVNAQVWNGTHWSAAAEFNANQTSAAYRSMDAAYEQTSGRGMVVYAPLLPDHTPKYRIWDGSGWGDEASATAIGDVFIRWLSLFPIPGTNRIVLLSLDGNNALYSQAWDGTEWGESQLISGNTGISTRQAYDASFKSDLDGMVAYGVSSDNVPRYRVWDRNTNTWGAEQSAKDIVSALYWARLVSDPTGDVKILATLDSATDLNVQVWNGTEWGDAWEIDATMESNARRCFDMAYETDTGRAVIAYGDLNLNITRYRVWNGSAWGNEHVSTMQAKTDVQWVALEPDRNSNDMLLMAMDIGNNLFAQAWREGNFTASIFLEPSARYNQQSFSAAYDTWIWAYIDIWDDTGAGTYYNGQEISFYANYSRRDGTAVSNASCRIRFNVSGWTPWHAMAYSKNAHAFKYTKSFQASGTFDWEVNCAYPPVVPRYANSTFSLSFDGAPPIIRIVRPSRGGKWNDTIANVTVEVTDSMSGPKAGSLDVRINTSEPHRRIRLSIIKATPIAGGYRYVLSSAWEFEDGWHNITASVEDWAGNTNSTKSYYYANLSLGTLVPGGGPRGFGAAHPRIIQNSSSAINVFHSFLDGMQIMGLHSLDYGGSWSGPVKVAENRQMHRAYPCALENGNTQWLFYASKGLAFMAYRNDSYASKAAVDNSLNPIRHLDCLAVGDSIGLALEVTGNRLYFVGSRGPLDPQRLGWNEPVFVAEGKHPAMGRDGAGNLYMFYENSSGIWLRTSADGIAWQSSGKILDGKGPSAHTSAAGAHYLAYNVGRKIYYAESPGYSPEFVAVAKNPNIVRDNLGSVWAAYDMLGKIYYEKIT